MFANLIFKNERADLFSGGFRGDNDKMEMRRPKMDFPLPAALKGLSGDKDKSFPTMSEFFERRNMKVFNLCLH